MTNNKSFKYKSPKLAKLRNLYDDNNNILCERCIQLNFRFKRNAKQIHHKNKDRKDNRPDNLMVVCSDCHRALHKELNHGSSDTNPIIPSLEMSLSDFLSPSQNRNNNNNNLIQYYNIVLDKRVGKKSLVGVSK